MSDIATPEEIITASIKALRNTTKKQGYLSLFEGHTGCHCALGVIASEVFGISDEHLETPPTRDLTYNAYSRIAMDGIGIDSIWEMNDTDGDTFEQIADEMEKSPSLFIKEYVED